jgi:septal ring-binding cell division protein DamX
MAQEKNNGLLKGIVSLLVAVLLVAACWFVFSKMQKSPTQQANNTPQLTNDVDTVLNALADKVVTKMKDFFQDENNPVKVGKMEVQEQTVTNQKVTTQQVATSKVDKQEVSQQNVANQAVTTQQVATSKVQQQTVEQQTVTNQNVANQHVDYSKVEKQDVVQQNVQTQNVDNQHVNYSKVERQDVTEQHVAKQIVDCQQLGTCSASVTSYQPPSCTSTCSSEGQSRCTPDCLTGDQRDVCVRSGNCLVWQRQDCTGGQYCDSGTCRDRIVTNERKCWNGDV